MNYTVSYQPGKGFIESDGLKQLFVKAHEIQTKFLADIKADFGVDYENNR